MDVTRDSSQRPDTWPADLTEHPQAGATQLSRVIARAVTRPLISQPPPARDELEDGPATQPLPRVIDPPATSLRKASALNGPRPARSEPAEPAEPATPAEAATEGHSARRPPRADHSIRERTAFSLPGWSALLVLLLAVAGVLAALMNAGVLASVLGLPDLRSPAALATGRPDLSAPIITEISAAGVLILAAVAGLLTNPGGRTRVLSRWGRYRGTVRRTGLIWVNPLLRCRQVDVRLRHWRSDPVQVTDRNGMPIMVRLLVVWRVRDTARVLFAIEEHETYLREQVEAVLTRTASTLPCDSHAEPGPALRDGQWFADELTRALAAETAPAGLEIYSVQPLSLDYAPEVAESMRRRRMAELDAGLRTALVDDAVEAAALAVRRLERVTAQDLDEAARRALMEHLLVAFVAPAGVTAVTAGHLPRSPRKEARSG
ncbi:SPFH domain-containing protein [Kitasatospora camelliae]|uniref:SPFH domain-containing protein n=1 Tax=Kitasatospora camelliae TaxID=3156397 RepID=A0AAU8JXJ2_9ACTN